MERSPCWCCSQRCRSDRLRMASGRTCSLPYSGELIVSTVASIPMTISAEATAHVAQLGMQAEFERMVEHTRQTIPGLTRINVVVDPPYDEGDWPAVVIEAWT